MPEVGDQPGDVFVLESDHIHPLSEPAEHEPVGLAECEVVRLEAGNHHSAGQVQSQALHRVGC